MGTFKTKVKVETSELLAAVEKRKADLLGKYEKELADYEAKYPKFVESVAKEIRDLADRFESGKTEIRYRYNDTLDVKLKTKPLTEPIKPDFRSIDRLIATLKIAAEPTIAISADDAAAYLG